MRIAIDFDGVIHDFRAGFTTASDTPGDVHPQALKFVRDAQKAGHTVMIHSGRSCGKPIDAIEATLNSELNFEDDGGKAAIERFLEEHGFPALPVFCRKPHADVFIDDLGYRFTGRFPSVKKLEKLKPWYKRGGLANQHGNTEDHEQEILTPSIVTDFARRLFNGRIQLDPCAADDTRETVCARDKFFGKAGPTDDGLAMPWQDKTFTNPPYGKLKLWLAKALAEASSGKRVVVLCPVRTNRKWFRAARDAARQLGAYVELNPIAFVGFTASFPVPLCLMCFNVSRSGVQKHVQEEDGLGQVL